MAGLTDNFTFFVEFENFTRIFTKSSGPTKAGSIRSRSASFLRVFSRRVTKTWGTGGKALLYVLAKFLLGL